MLNRLKQMGLRQYNVGKWAGAYYVQVVQSMTFVGMFNTAMIGLVAWDSSIGNLAARYASWLTLPLFALLVIAVLFGIVPWLDYKFLMPSRQGYANRQGYAHGNPAVEDLHRILANQAALLRESRALERKINRLASLIKNGG